jgi:nuclear pore complex protein Nup62
MTPLDMVVRILNNQLSSLMWIDEKVNIFYPDPFYLKNNVMFINLSFTIKCVQDFHTN